MITNCILLFFSFLKIGAFSFGGGYAAMPLIQAQVINQYHWLTLADFTNLVTISQMTPGPIAINAATFVGNQVAGIPGALSATFGCILPPCLFVAVLARLYTKYRNLNIMKGILECLHPAVTAMILSAGLDILIPALFPKEIPASLRPRFVVYFLVALFFLQKRKTDPIKVMVACGAAELLYQGVLRILA